MQSFQPLARPRSTAEQPTTSDRQNAARHGWDIEAAELPDTRVQLGRLGNGNIVEGQSKIKRAATIALASSCLLSCVATTSAAQPEDSEAAATEDGGASTEGIVEKKPRLNSIRLSGVYAFQILKERSSQATGERLETRESFGGFEMAYQRDLIEEHLAIELASVFVFSADTFEAPFKVTLQGLFVKGSWEGYIGPVLGYNIRVFSTERAMEEGRSTIVSFGVGATIGGSYHFTERWGLELGFDYAFGVADPVVAHDFGFALGGVYYF